MEENVVSVQAPIEMRLLGLPLNTGSIPANAVTTLTIKLVQQRCRGRRILRPLPVHVRSPWTLRGLHDLEILPIRCHVGSKVERQREGAGILHPVEGSARPITGACRRRGKSHSLFQARES